MARLALGLRTCLQNDAGNVEGWLMLGRTGMVLGNAGTATGAYANAYRLDPKNRDAALGYAEALTRSSDPEDNRRGGELLRQLVSRDHTDIRVLSLYAFSAFEQQRFGEAVAAWEMMLKLLPAGDARRAVIERSIRTPIPGHLTASGWSLMYGLQARHLRARPLSVSMCIPATWR